MMLHRIAPGLALGLALITSGPARADLALPRISPNATVTQTLGITDLTVKYSRPGVKNRPIWGALVPYGKPWRTGANDATNFTTTDPITVAGKPLPAGTYALFTIPTADEWTVIFSKQKDLWGAVDYDSTQDMFRVNVKPTAGESLEWMEFSFENLTPQSADLVLSWEKVRVAVPITVDVNAITMAKGRAELTASMSDDWRTRYRLAQFCFDQGIDLADASKWLDQSIAIKPGYSNQALRARWLAKDGKKKEAGAVAQKAIAAGKAAKPPADTSSLEKDLASWTAN
jgi:hypothetical protein